MNENQNKIIREGVKYLLKGKWEKFIIALFLVLIILFIDGYYNNKANEEVDLHASTVQTASLEDFKTKAQVTAKVTKVVDGDTIYYEKDGQKHQVRLVGIDTPETKDPRKPVQCFGQTASEKTKSLLEGKTAYFQKDSKQTLDKYGRELWYVYSAEGIFVNRYLVSEGFAFATPQYNFEWRDDFVNLEKEARILGKGLWNLEICKYKNQYGN